MDEHTKKILAAVGEMITASELAETHDREAMLAFERKTQAVLDLYQDPECARRIDGACATAPGVHDAPARGWVRLDTEPTVPGGRRAQVRADLDRLVATLGAPTPDYGKVTMLWAFSGPQGKAVVRDYKGSGDAGLWSIDASSHDTALAFIQHLVATCGAEVLQIDDPPTYRTQDSGLLASDPIARTWCCSAGVTFYESTLCCKACGKAV